MQKRGERRAPLVQSTGWQGGGLKLIEYGLVGRLRRGRIRPSSRHENPSTIASCGITTIRNGLAEAYLIGWLKVESPFVSFALAEEPTVRKATEQPATCKICDVVFITYPVQQAGTAV